MAIIVIFMQMYYLIITQQKTNGDVDSYRNYALTIKGNIGGG